MQQQKSKNETRKSDNNGALDPVIRNFLLSLVGLFGLSAVLFLTIDNAPESRTAPAVTDAETTVDVEPAPELAMRIVYGDSHWRWIVPLLIFFLVIDGTVITMHLASISKKLDRLPQAPSP